MERSVRWPRTDARRSRLALTWLPGLLVGLLLGLRRGLGIGSGLGSDIGFLPGLFLGLLLGLPSGSCQRDQAPPPRSAGAAAYDAYRRPEQLVAALQLQPGQRVAEIGAGGGYLTGYLARAVGPSGRVVATDISAAALAALRQRTRGLAQVEARSVTASAPGLEPGLYDLILLAQVDHLLPDREAYLRSLPPALNRTGRIVLTNSVRHREAARAAITAAGFLLEEQDAGLPEQFVFVVRPR